MASVQKQKQNKKKQTTKNKKSEREAKTTEENEKMMNNLMSGAWNVYGMTWIDIKRPSFTSQFAISNYFLLRYKFEYTLIVFCMYDVCVLACVIDRVLLPFGHCEYLS